MTDGVRGAGRGWLLLWATWMLAACGTPGPYGLDAPQGPEGHRDPTGVSCFDYRRNHAPQRMCATPPSPLPPTDLAAPASPFLPAEGGGQVVVQWVERAGATRPLVLIVDGRAVAELLPAALVRMRLQPGPHVLAVMWAGQRTVATVQVEAGSVYNYEIKGWVHLLAWGFEWDVDNSPRARQRAQEARIIADIDLR